MRALARSGSVEAATRRLAIWTLFASAGRSSETATITFDGLEWDAEMNGGFVEIIQTKAGKFKLIALVAGRDRHCDYFLFLADFLTMHKPSTYFTTRRIHRSSVYSMV